MRIGSPSWIALGILALVATSPGGAAAALKKYNVPGYTVVQQSADASPVLQLSKITGPGYAVIDPVPSDPVLKKLLIVADDSITVDVPDLGGFIFINGTNIEGPTGEFTGTGSAETTIAWGLVTGWTQTGTQWCHSNPSYICGLVGRVNQESTENFLPSTFYDLGTWTFHGTGFTTTPFLYIPFEPPNPGNSQYVFRAPLLTDGSVPALPVLTLGLVAAGLVGMGRIALQRRRQ
jgi:hypothetical protein